MVGAPNHSRSRLVGNAMVKQVDRKWLAEQNLVCALCREALINEKGIGNFTVVEYEREGISVRYCQDCSKIALA